MSDYTLKLKATLDTSEVQQKLQQLLQSNAQRGSTQNNGSNNGTANPLYNGINYNSLILSSLNRLVQSILQLTNNLNKSPRQSAHIGGTSGSSNGLEKILFPHGMSASNNMLLGNINDIRRERAAYLKQELKKIYKGLGTSASQEEATYARNSPIYRDLMNTDLQSMLKQRYTSNNKLINWYKGQLDGLKLLNKEFPNEPGFARYGAYLNYVQERNLKRNYGPLAIGLAGHVILGEATKWKDELPTFGRTKLFGISGKNAPSIDNDIIRGAGYTAQTAGPGLWAGAALWQSGLKGAGATMAIGTAIVGLIEAIYKIKTDKMNETAKGISEIGDALANLNEKVKNFDKYKYSESIKGKDSTELKKLFSYSDESLIDAKTDYMARMSYLKEELYNESRLFMADLFKAGDDLDKKHSVELRHNNKVSEIQADIAEVEKNYKNAQDYYDISKKSYYNQEQFEHKLLKNAIESALIDNNYLQYMAKDKLTKQLNSKNYGIYDIEKDLLPQMDFLQNALKEKHIELQDFFNNGGFSAITDKYNKDILEARKNGDTTGEEFLQNLYNREIEAHKQSIDIFVKLNNEYNELDNVLKNYKETLKNLNHGIAQSKISFVLEDITTKLNSELQDLNDPYNHISFREKFDTAAAKLREYREQYREQRKGSLDLFNKAEATDNIKEKQELILQANDMNSAASFTLSLVANLESFISNLNPLVAKPELGAVQSLGQYGFNMGENNDSFERQLEYLQRQLECQEEIRNILKEKSYNDEATFA